jgi:hypothetical protein
VSIYIFSNFKITDVRMPHDDDGVNLRIHGSSDITRTIAEKMGWEIMHSESGVLSGLSSASLSGELNLAWLSLIPNGDLKPQSITEVPAKLARDFKLTTRQGEEGDAEEAGLKFVITLPATSAKRIIDYRLKVGAADAQLKLNVIGDAQMNLNEQAEADAEEEKATARPAGGPMLASASEMEQAKKNRDAAKKAGVPFQ